ncbi:MAG: hypothetical protein L0312_06410, partial [Acidobacteria bacterium]|nr:hypothetical protein [Acidobacteriota bacterium]
MAKAKVSHQPQTQKSDQQQPLGTLIAAVLAHSDTPSEVYSGIVDGLAELQSGTVGNRPEAIQAAIDLAKYRGAESKGDDSDDEEESKTVTI